MTNTTEPGADVYSAGERSAMQWTQRLRGRLLAPMLKLLVRLGVRADHVTLASLIVGLTFCPLWFWMPAAAFAALAVHVALDAVDGALARFTQSASRRGSFTDTMSDQMVVAITTITLMAAEPHVIDVLTGGVYIFLYTIVVGFAMVRNAMGIPYHWVVRPRFFVYGWMVVETYWWPHTIDYVIWLFNAVLALKLASGFFRIRAKL